MDQVNKKQFYVSMGTFNGAEVSEFIGLSILSNITESINFESIGLYRGDDLTVLKSVAGSESEHTKKRLKRIIKTLQDDGLSITSQTNLTNAIFLYITLNLRTESYKPYLKPNNQPFHILKHSNHPRHIIKT